MSPADYFVLAIAVALSVLLAVVFLVGLWLHERREFRRQDQQHGYVLLAAREHEEQAGYRERRAVERHDEQVIQLTAMENIVRGVRAQRDYLTDRVEVLEKAVTDHATHLEQLGRVDVLKVKGANR